MHKLIETNLDNVKALCRSKHVQKMWTFGSVNSDQFTDESDIDFLVSIDASDEIVYADCYFDLCDELERLFNRKVDVITEKSLSNPFFIQQVMTSRELLYEQ